MILTIGMIVKNEADKLEKCLLSLKPLRDAVSSELIIVDTGSTDNTVQIAQKFTDDVRYFEWCKDFSAARNKSMEDAKGEWFMFIDADEWFENTDELISFFASGEYKRYNSATYIQRNYTSTNINGHYLDFDALRLTKILPDTKFVDKIHEWLNTTAEPIKKISSFAHHFGYAEVNDGDRENKRKRNEELLLKSLEENDKKVSLYFQLFDCYYGVDNNSAVMYARKGIKVNKELNYNIYGEYVFLKLIACAYLTDKKYDEVLEIVSEYYLKRNNNRDIERFIATDVDIAAIDAYANHELGNSEKAISACIKFNNTYTSFKAGKHSMAEVLMSAVRYANETERVNINIIYFKELFKLSKTRDAMVVLKRLTVENIIKYTGYRYAEQVIGYVLDIIQKNSDYVGMSELFHSMKFDEKLTSIFEHSVVSRFYSENGADTRLIQGIVKNVSTDLMTERFNQSIKLYYNLFCADIKNVDFTCYTDSFDVLPEYLADVIWLSIKRGNENEFKQILKIVSVDNINAYINSMLVVSEFAVDFIGYMKNHSCEDIISKYLMIKLSETIIYSEKINDEVTIDLFRQFSKVNFEYLCLVCRPEYINDDKIEALPSENKKSYYCYMACKAFDMNDVKLCTHYMRKAALLDIRLKKVVSAMSNVSSDAKVYGQGVTAEQAEFDMLSRRIKDNIIEYISVGDNVSASKLLFEYSQINPNDKTINELSKMINAIIVD